MTLAKSWTTKSNTNSIFQVQYELNLPNRALYIKGHTQGGGRQKDRARRQEGEAEQNKVEEEENRRRKQRGEAKSKRRAASQQEGGALILTLYFFCRVFILSLAPPEAPQTRELSLSNARRPREVFSRRRWWPLDPPLVTINISPLGSSSCYNKYMAMHLA